MKKSSFIMAMLVILFVFGIPLWAQSEDDFEVSQNRDNTLTITGYKGSVKDVVIPGALYGLRVTSIGSNVFEEKALTGVVIPNTVTTIGSYAFYQNKNLTEVNIPDSVTEIGYAAFGGCGITKLSLGRAVQTIHDRAFSTNQITQLTLPATLKVIGESAFAGNMIKSLTIPNGVTLIGTEAFKNNPIETLVIPASLTQWRFENNYYGFSVVVTGISPRVFEGCPLTRITMPANMSENVFHPNANAGFEQSMVKIPPYSSWICRAFRDILRLQRK